MMFPGVCYHYNSLKDGEYLHVYYERGREENGPSQEAYAAFSKYAEIVTNPPYQNNDELINTLVLTYIKHKEWEYLL